MLLREHVHCVAITFQMTEPAEERVCIKFCNKLEYWDDSQGHSYGQLVIGSFVTTTRPLRYHLSCRVFAKHQITQVTQPQQPDLVPCDFWLFPKLKPPFKGKRFQTVSEIQENTMGQLMVLGRTV